jgi:hypothetical protein
VLLEDWACAGTAKQNKLNPKARAVIFTELSVTGEMPEQVRCFSEHIRVPLETDCLLV